MLPFPFNIYIYVNVSAIIIEVENTQFFAFFSTATCAVCQTLTLTFLLVAENERRLLGARKLLSFCSQENTLYQTRRRHQAFICREESHGENL
jgi:hypothetical protein